MSVKSIMDIIDRDFLMLCRLELSPEYFSGELGAFHICGEIDSKTFCFVLDAIPLDFLF